MIAANYDEAIATLKKRFGNPQLIVNRHIINTLLNTAAILLDHDVKGLSRLDESVEAHIRELWALGISVMVACYHQYFQ